MLLEDLIHEANNSEWSIVYKPEFDAVIHNEFKALEEIGVFFVLCEYVEPMKPSIKRYSNFKVFEDDDQTIQTIRDRKGDSNNCLVISLVSYLHAILSFNVTEYVPHSETYLHNIGECMLTTLRFYSPSKDRIVDILLRDINNKDINRLKITARDFRLDSVSLNPDSILEDLRICPWKLDVGDFDDNE